MTRSNPSRIFVLEDFMHEKSPIGRSEDGAFDDPALMSRRQALGLLGGSLALASPAFGSVNMTGGSKPGPALETRLTREYGVLYPLVCAGMAFVGTESLAAAVANTGGIGMLGAGPEQPNGVLAMIEATRRLTNAGAERVAFLSDGLAIGYDDGVVQIVDHAFFMRFVAGNAAFHVRALGGEGTPNGDRVLAWARQVLARTPQTLPLSPRF